MNSQHKMQIAFAIVVLALIGGGIWYMVEQQKMAQYVEAAADCSSGRGDGKLRALDRLNGEDARPKSLAFDLSLCALSEAVDRYEQIMKLMPPG